MKFCPKCGAECAEEVNVCPICGADMSIKDSAGATAANNAEAAVRNILDTPDTTADYDANDIEANKIYSILAYLGFLVFIPFFAAKKSPFARYHTNQGLVLLICELVVAAISSVLWVLPIVGQLLSLLMGLPIYLVTVAYMVIGIINAYNGKAKELPYIGRIKLLK